MGLIGRILSIFGGGSRADETEPPSEPEPEPEPESESEAQGEAEEEEEDGGMPTKSVAEMADPRRSEDEANTVENRATNPDDQRAT